MQLRQAILCFDPAQGANFLKLTPLVDVGTKRQPALAPAPTLPHPSPMVHELDDGDDGGD